MSGGAFQDKSVGATEKRNHRVHEIRRSTARCLAPVSQVERTPSRVSTSSGARQSRSAIAGPAASQSKSLPALPPPVHAARDALPARPCAGSTGSPSPARAPDEPHRRYPAWHRARIRPRKLQNALKKEPSEYLRQLYYDSMVFTPEGLRHLIAEVGMSQIEAGLVQARTRAESLPKQPRVFFEGWDDPLISGIGWIFRTGGGRRWCGHLRRSGK
jgi:hypothetical protein